MKKEITINTPNYSNKDNISILSWKEFKAQNFEEPEWILENFIPQGGLIAVAGAPESFKSFFTTYLAILIASGGTLFGKYQSKQTAVLLIDQENVPGWIQKRINMFTDNTDIPLYIYDQRSPQFSIENEEQFKKLVEIIQENKIGLVIIDTLRLIHDQEENSSTEMKIVFDLLKKLKSYATILFIHHHKKADRYTMNRITGEDMMGSIFIRGSLDYQITITRIATDNEVTKIRITQTKSRYVKPLKPFDVLIQENNGKLAFIYEGEAQEEKIKIEEAKETILSLLVAGQNFTKNDFIDQIVKKNICSKRTLETALSQLNKEGKITHTGKPHVYSLINPFPNNSQLATTYSDEEIAREAEETSNEYYERR